MQRYNAVAYQYQGTLPIGRVYPVPSAIRKTAMAGRS